VPVDGPALAAWPLWYVDHCNVFVIATESEAARERRALWPAGVFDPGTTPEFERKVREGRF
jgi:hypothetical protein